MLDELDAAGLQDDLVFMGIVFEGRRHHTAARATIVALRATIMRATGQRSNYIMLLPDPTPLADEDAVKRLARMPKPLVCTAFSALGVMAIACWDHATIERKGAGVATAVGRDTLDSVAAQYGPTDNTRFLLRAGQTELLLTWLELQTWFSTYVMLLTGYAFDAAEAGRADGAVAILTFLDRGSGNRITIADVDEG